MKNFDCNLARYLKYLIEYRSVTHAAEELGVAVSTVSYNLSRLRREFNDPIMVNSRAGLIPTALALKVNENFSAAIDLIDQALFSGAEGHSQEERLVINTGTLIQHWFNFHLMTMEKTQKEGMTYIHYIDHNYNTEERLIKLRNREVDIDIGAKLPADKSLLAYCLGVFPIKILLSLSHPRIGEEITDDDWVKEQHISWDAGKHGMVVMQGTNIFNENIAKTSVAIETMSTLNIVTLVANSDYLAVFPVFMQEMLLKQFKVKLLSSPFPINSSVSIYAYIHRQKASNTSVIKCIELLKSIN